VEQHLSEMFAELEETTTHTVAPSLYWLELNRKHCEHLERTGFEHFKRTLAKEYFTWMRIWPWDSQIRFLLGHLPMRNVAAAVVKTFRPPKHKYIPLAESLALNFLTHLVHAYVDGLYPQDMSRLEEPAVGSPPEIWSRGRRISQDVANAVLEYRSVVDAIPAPDAIETIYELGAGYGRTAFAFLSLQRLKKYVVIDIPPALRVAEMYLTRVFPEKRAFRFRRFERFDDVREEFEAAEMAFLMPTQVERLPDGSADLFLNISSLQEMTLPQIRYYVGQIERLLRPGGYFYLKEWKEFANKHDGMIVRAEDYPVTDWTKLFWRTARVQTRFFEALVEKPERKP